MFSSGYADADISPPLGIHGQRMRFADLARAAAGHTELHEVSAVCRELDDAVVGRLVRAGAVAVGH